MTTSTWWAKIGEEGKTLTTTLKDADGAVTLSGTITFTAKSSDGTHTISGTATADPDQVTNKGKVSFTLLEAHLVSGTAVPGAYRVQWKVVWDANNTDIFPNPGTDVLIVEAAVA